ncbi:general secretion pathway protein J [Luteibacter sp. 1214]|uniref:hypothetical protein n=1 Tax=Luteibacter sp. 1214 TaxID=2817735 RepID=UPI00285D264B|nr:hypothetical protein [Luteibacter sp. 1214]MDR6644715.1 general secretion pathway protein J [Luteibacter sp. 1214]
MVKGRISRGFSLMETLGALALLALLLLGVMAALQVITKSTQASMTKTQRVNEVRAAQGYVRASLSGALAYPFERGKARRPVAFKGEEHALTFVAPGPGYLARSGLQVQALSLIEKEGEWRLEVAFAGLPTRGGARMVPDAPEVLMDHVVSGRFVYSGVDDDRHAVAWASSWPYTDRLPTMVGVELTLRGGISWPVLVVPLRMDPAATNVREGLSRLDALDRAGQFGSVSPP